MRGGVCGGGGSGSVPLAPTTSASFCRCAAPMAAQPPTYPPYASFLPASAPPLTRAPKSWAGGGKPFLVSPGHHRHHLVSTQTAPYGHPPPPPGIDCHLSPQSREECGGPSCPSGAFICCSGAASRSLRWGGGRERGVMCVCGTQIKRTQRSRRPWDWSLVCGEDPV